jgi:uncharacterized protein YdaU (DUF1376 family)
MQFGPYLSKHVLRMIDETAHFGARELGVYQLLLHWYAQHERRLPGVDESLHRIARVSSTEDQVALLNVLEEFFEPGTEPSPKGEPVAVWIHRELERELAKAARRRTHAAEAANARWLNVQLSNAQPELDLGADAKLASAEHRVSIARASREHERKHLLAADAAPSARFQRPPEQPRASRGHRVSMPRAINQNEVLINMIDSAAVDKSALIHSPKNGAHIPASTKPDEHDKRARLAEWLAARGVIAPANGRELVRWVAEGVSRKALELAIEHARRFQPAPLTIGAYYLDKTLRTLAAVHAQQRAPPT